MCFIDLCFDDSCAMDMLNAEYDSALGESGGIGQDIVSSYKYLITRFTTLPTFAVLVFVFAIFIARSTSYVGMRRNV